MAVPEWMLGDERLRQFSNRLVKAIGLRDSVGRLGGDEFALILTMTREQEQEPVRVANEIRESLRAAVDDPARFALEWGLPTVAASDPDFSSERMWRGPIWINTSALVAEGLEASGCRERARELREQTVRLVVHGGGPHEYYNPRTGLKAQTATTAFGWSAALFIDLAVSLS